MGRRRLTDPERKKKKEPEPFVLYDPRCEQCYYWRKFGSFDDEKTMCCHFVLIEGKLRDQISRTECGSFKDGTGIPKRIGHYTEVPMTQWGCGGLATIRRGER